MQKIRFYSEQNFMSGRDLNLIIETIKNYKTDHQPDINNILEFYNILKYLKIDRFKKHIERRITSKIGQFITLINRKIGQFISSNKGTFLCSYNSIEHIYINDFFEMVEKYKVYYDISYKSMNDFLEKEKRALHYILKRKGLVEYYNEVVKDSILSEAINTELILNKYYSKETLFLPTSLKSYEVEELIGRYLDLDRLKISQLRMIIYLPSNIELKLSNKLKLKAEKRLRQEKEKLLRGNNGIRVGVNIVYTKEQGEVFKETRKGTEVTYSINEKWISDNLDFNTLWNNFIYIFKYFDRQCRLNLVSKINEAGPIERIISSSCDHTYNVHSAFVLHEMTSKAQLDSYSKVLSLYDVRIEEMIEWFFTTYLEDEFKISNFIINIPSDNFSFIEKCRMIVPEIERILKQYNIYVQEGTIDYELLEVSSQRLHFSRCDSLVGKKYVYPASDYFRNVSYSLFSDQSGSFYIPKFNTYNNLAELIQEEQVQYSDFAEYQLQEIDSLIENGLLAVDNSGSIAFADILKIIIFGDLYFNEVISYWHQSLKYREKLDDLINSGVLKCESSLFAKKEQDYLDFYLNRTKFTNGYDLRNRYVHGTHSNNKQQHEMDYNTLLKIIVIIVIKINDDLCLGEDNPHASESARSNKFDLSSWIS